MGMNHELNTRSSSPKSTLFSTKASKVQQVRKSHSSPSTALNHTHELPVPQINPSMILPSSSNSEHRHHNSSSSNSNKKSINYKPTIPISPGSNKNKKKRNTNTTSNPMRLNTKLSNINHFSSSHSPSSPQSTITTTTSTHDRPNLRMSASSRFGKNLLPTWLGGHSTEEDGTSPTSSIHSANSSSSNLTANTPPLSASAVSLKSSSSTLTISNCSINNGNEGSSSTDSPNMDASELTSTFETLLVSKSIPTTTPY